MNIHPNSFDYRGNWISQAIYYWLEEFFYKGLRKKLTDEDLFPCPKEQSSKLLFGKFEKYWNIELAKKENPDIKIALAKTLKWEFIISGVLQFVEAVLLLLQAMLVSNFASIFTENASSEASRLVGSALGYGIAISLILLYLVFHRAICNNYVYSMGIQLRTICTTALYEKAIKLQQATLHRIFIGQILNLMSNDVYKLEFGITYWNFIWISPVITVLSIIVSYIYIGNISLLASGYIVLLTPMQILAGYLFGRFRNLQSITADERINITDQIIRGMHVIKLYVWEKSFMEYISEIRRKEMRFAGMAGFTQCITLAFYNNSLFLSLLILYIFGFIVNNPLTSAELALVYLLFGNLRTFSVLYIGFAILTGRESVIALRRIQNILELSGNIDHYHSQSTYTYPDHPSIELIDFTASWNKTSCNEDLTLKRINFKMDRARLVAITGPVGSGKSSFLMSLINELPGVSGIINIIGTISYAAQEPWIFSGTFRENILFGKPFHSHRYQQVLAVCSLAKDMKLFVEGDLTLMGERGVTLSGGQKSRVSLARAIYKEADIYLLDDPLSAVDVEVGRNIYSNCVRGFLMDKIVLLVTHHIQYVKQAEEIVVMKGGSVVCSGSYSNVVTNHFCREFLRDLEKIEEKNTLVVPNFDFFNEMSGDVYSVEHGDTFSENQPLSQFLTKEDYRPTSSSLMTYIHYFWKGGLFMTVLLICFTVLSNALLFLSYWWMQSYTACSSNMDLDLANISLANLTNLSCSLYFSPSTYSSLGLISLFTFSGCICMFLYAIIFYYILLQASRRLHNSMLYNIMYSPMYFFQSNPSGRILNRFSKDLGSLDEQLPFLFYFFWVHASYIIAVIIASCATQYVLIIPFSISFFTTLLLRYYFLKTSTQVRRLESVARSPLYSHISISLLGLSTIRALGNEKGMTHDFHHFQDKHTTAWYNYAMCSRWFETRLDLIASLVSISGVFLALFSYYILGLYQLVGFSLPLLLSIPFSFQYLVRVSTDVELMMVSVDRILNYCRIPREYNSSETSKLPSVTIRDRGGEIEFVNVSFKYCEELPFSLTNVSFRILPGEKIGIIGRTGAGKSSLFNALCRMREVSDGCILVDGVDISGLDLYAHRKRISIIPQDPVLFAGTLRYNLDPFDEFSCDEIWAAVESCHLLEMMKSLPNSLMSCVQDDGRNFSTGERQLLCLARAILRKNRIILIDEATANVDHHTDLFIQKAISTNFTECTVLTIAHRLETILHSHRIIVLDKTWLIELDAPNVMLGKENSYLKNLMVHLNPVT